MDLKILLNEKDEMEVELENVTLAEILRVYLNKDNSVTFAAWKRVHPTEKPVLKFKTKGKTTKKAIGDAVKEIVKELDKVESDFSKAK